MTAQTDITDQLSFGYWQDRAVRHLGEKDVVQRAVVRRGPFVIKELTKDKRRTLRAVARMSGFSATYLSAVQLKQKTISVGAYIALVELVLKDRAEDRKGDNDWI